MSFSYFYKSVVFLIRPAEGWPRQCLFILLDTFNIERLIQIQLHVSHNKQSWSFVEFDCDSLMNAFLFPHASYEILCIVFILFFASFNRRFTLFLDDSLNCGVCLLLPVPVRTSHWFSYSSVCSLMSVCLSVCYIHFRSFKKSTSITKYLMWIDSKRIRNRCVCVRSPARAFMGAHIAELPCFDCLRVLRVIG